ncbi:IS66-like element accessory protein TnpA [Bradyrhizobium glycinis]|uniref:IS66-like element accessory protein TnpA n=1 Tax=Bradyrhizobium glycinis TaxID=2751812 RepID=UPI0018D81A5D|nr:transposase [Bradyrhizobium glycinis]
MTDHMPMPKVSRLEVVSTGARRRWTLEEKQRIVTESYGRSRLVSVTARRNGLSTSQLFTWRRLAREGKLNGDAAPVLVPVEITPAAAPISSGAPQPVSSPPVHRARAGTIEIELGGCRVRVDRDVDVEALQRVLEILRRR